METKLYDDCFLLIPMTDWSNKNDIREIREWAKRAVEDGAREIMIDCEHVTVIPACVVGQLLLLYKEMEKRNIRISLSNVSATLRGVLKRLMFHNLFDF